MVNTIMFGWIPVVVVLFSVLPHRRAVIAAFLFAWLFMPVTSYPLAMIPDYTKMSATSTGVFLATLIFSPNRILSFRPRWYDLPAAVFCICPLFSSLANGLGLYDGMSTALTSVFRWGLPYLIGRIYFNDLAGMRELAIGVFIGGLIYVPLCLFEIRMSPQLHTMVYGFHQHSFAQTRRFSGWRPTVFMQHGLMVGMWMCMAALSGFWMWRAGGLKRFLGMPTVIPVAILAATAVLCKSNGATILFGLGLGIFAGIKWFRTSWLPGVLSGMVILYLVVRAAGIWDGAELISILEATLGPNRSESLNFRMYNEDILSDHARKQPVFGWGTFARNRPKDVQVVIDSLWIAILGKNGFVGLISVTAMFLLPLNLLRWRIAPRYWNHPAVAPAVCFAVICLLYMIDNLANGMYNPIFILMIGGLAGLKKTGPAPRAASRPAPSQQTTEYETRERL